MRASPIFFLTGLAILYLSGCGGEFDEQSEPREDLPVFPWPVPAYSSFERVPSNFLQKTDSLTTLYDVSEELESALKEAGYGESSYYSVPNGFALVTRLEQINRDGTPKSGPERWAVKTDRPEVWNIVSYFKALGSANEGFFRVIAFVVTDTTLQVNHNLETPKDSALKWVHQGGVYLPREYDSVKFSDEFKCTALIYEFEKAARDTAATVQRPGRLPGRVHLEKAALYSALK